MTYTNNQGALLQAHGVTPSSVDALRVEVRLETTATHYESRLFFPKKIN
jgi:hypothetical protein